MTPGGRSPEDGAGDPAADHTTVQPSAQSWSLSGRHATDLAVLQNGVLDDPEKFDRWTQHRQLEERFMIIRMTVWTALATIGARTVQQVQFGDPDLGTYALTLIALIAMFGVLAVVLAVLYRRKPRCDHSACDVQRPTQRDRKSPEH